MFDKLEALEERFLYLSEKISDPEVIQDQASFRKYCKEHSDLSPIIDKYREYKKAKQTIGGADAPRPTRPRQKMQRLQHK